MTDHTANTHAAEISRALGAPRHHERHWRSRYLESGNVYEMAGLDRRTEAEVRASADHDRKLGYRVDIEYRDLYVYAGFRVITDWTAEAEEHADV